ncbi:MAG: hypothetical protein ABI882_21130 [Acidobacteriota bacterium]
MTNAIQTRDIVRSYLDRHTSELDAALRHVLAEPITLEPGRCIQFEVDPWYYGIHLCATEEIVMGDDWLLGELLQNLSDEVLEKVLEVVTELLINWLADAWERVGGPQRYRPAFAFLHGYREQFDLEQRRWLSESAG